MNKSLLMIFLSVTIELYGQGNIKTNTEDLQGGKATYQYYENPVTGSFVKHGTFSYIKKDKGYTETVTGSFNKGLRNGIWTYKIIGTDYPNSIGSYTTRTMNATLTYKDGMPDGLWKLADLSKIRDKRLAPHNTFRWSAYEIIADNNVTLRFKDGVAVGTVTYKNNGKVSTYTLNDAGYMVGTLTLNRYIGTETIVSKDGVVVKDIIRDSSGKVIDDSSFTLADEDKWKSVALKYMKGEMTEGDVMKLGADIFEKEVPGSIDVEVMFQHDYLYLRGIGGDRTLKENSSGTTRNYGKYIVVKPIGKVHYSEHPVWKNRFTVFGKNMSDCSVVRYMADSCANTLYPEDVLELKRIVSEQEKQEQSKRNKAEYDKYITLITGSINTWRDSVRQIKCDAVMAELNDVSETNEIINCICDNWHISDYINAVFDEKYSFEYKTKDITEDDVKKMKEKLGAINTELEGHYFTKVDSAINNIKKLNNKVNEATVLLAKKDIYRCYKELIIGHLNDSEFDNGRYYNTAMKLTDRLLQLNKKEYKSVIERVRLQPSLMYKITSFLTDPDKYVIH